MTHNEISLMCRTYLLLQNYELKESFWPLLIYYFARSSEINYKNYKKVEAEKVILEEFKQYMIALTEFSLQYKQSHS